MKKTIFIAGGVVILLAMGAWCFFAIQPLPFNLDSDEQSQELAAASSVNSGVPTSPVFLEREVPAGYTEYQSPQFRFSVLYAQEMSVAEFDEAGGARTFTFEDISDSNNLKGFQLFIVPHSTSGVTASHVQTQVPSATLFEDVVVDGAPGLAFVSSDGGFGEVREVWFVKNGFLYQAATPRPLEALIHEVLQHWQFL